MGKVTHTAAAEGVFATCRIEYETLGRSFRWLERRYGIGRTTLHHTAQKEGWVKLGSTPRPEDERIAQELEEAILATGLRHRRPSAAMPLNPAVPRPNGRPRKHFRPSSKTASLSSKTASLSSKTASLSSKTASLSSKTASQSSKTPEGGEDPVSKETPPIRDYRRPEHRVCGSISVFTRSASAAGFGPISVRWAVRCQSCGGLPDSRSHQLSTRERTPAKDGWSRPVAAGTD